MNEPIFNNIANHYENEERKFLANIISKKIVEEINGNFFTDILDFGCGTGLVSETLFECCENLYLMDISSKMLEVAKEKFKDIKKPKIFYECIDLLENDFCKNDFDLIICSLTLLHIKDTDKILEKLTKMLKQNGVLIIVDFITNSEASHPLVHSGFNTYELKEKLEKNNMNNFKIETFYKGEKIFMNKDAELFMIKCKKRS